MIGQVRRLDSWSSKLNDFINERRGTPFIWGANDCCTFAARAIEAMTGVYLPEMAGLPEYGSVESAMRLARQLCSDDDPFGCLRWPEEFGFKEIGTRFARRGDLVCIHQTIEEREMYCLGVCVGTYAACPGEKCLGFADLSRVLKAWRV